MSDERPEILFLNPLVGDAYEFTRPNRPLPLGILAAATYLERDYRITIVDERMDPDWPQRAAASLARRPVFVGISVMGGPQIREGVRLSRWVKEHAQDPDVPVVWGGVFPSLAPEVVLQERSVDIVCIGEGERTAPELAAALRDGTNLKDVAGLAFRDGDAALRSAILRSEERLLGDLREVPRLPYHLVDVHRYNFSLASGPEPGKLKLVMETSRGCSYSCVYCYNPVFYRHSWRARTPEQVVDEIAFLKAEYGVSSIDFLDDDIFEEPERMVAIAEGLIARDLDIEWLANGVTILSIDTLSDDALRTLRRSGFTMLNMGAESGSDRLLDRMGRGARVADIERINERLGRFDIRPAFYFSTGMEGETAEDLKSTVDLMFRVMDRNANAKIVASFCLTPIPGTGLTQSARAAGIRLPETLAEWAESDSTHSILAWVGRKHRRAMEAIFFLALFVDGKAAEVAGSPLARLAARLYQPIARWRLRHMRFEGLAERSIVQALLRLLNWRRRNARIGASARTQLRANSAQGTS